MRHTIVALFDTYGRAEDARETLVRAGFARTDVELQAQPEPTADTAVSGHSPGVLASIERFLSSLFASNRDGADMQRYTDAVRGGAVLVCVQAADEPQAELARNALTQLGALSIAEREPGWDTASADPEARRAHSLLDELGIGGLGSAFPAARDPLPADDVPVARDVRPVGAMSEDVPLDDVPLSSSTFAAAPGLAPNDDMAAQAAIAAAGAPGAGAVMGAGAPAAEQAVAAPAEMPVETSQRQTMFSGSATAASAGTEARPAEAAAAGMSARAGWYPSTAAAPETSVPDEYLEYEEDFRSHYDDLFAGIDTQYEDYRPAYHYGANMARDERYRDRPWDEVEPEVQRQWETSPSDNTWERFKAAVRHGWDRVTGHHHV